MGDGKGEEERCDCDWVSEGAERSWSEEKHNARQMSAASIAPLWPAAAPPLSSAPAGPLVLTLTCARVCGRNGAPKREATLHETRTWSEMKGVGDCKEKRQE